MDEQNQPEGAEQPSKEILEKGDKPTTPVEAPEQPKHHKRQELPKKLVKEPQKIAAPKQSMTSKMKSFWMECKRVLRITKKPDRQEFIMIVKISAAGMAIIGVIGFAIHLVKELLI